MAAGGKTSAAKKDGGGGKPSGKPSAANSVAGGGQKNGKAVLTIAVSSRALFNLEAENKIFQNEGVEVYRKTQWKRVDNVPAPGVAFPMVRKLLAFNQKRDAPLVDVIIVSRNDPVSGLRVFRAIKQNKLNIERACFTRGAEPFPYLSAFSADLFLSAAAADVREALNNGIPAAHVLGGGGRGGGGGKAGKAADDNTLRIAFDGDAVLFGDEAEIVYQEKGLPIFIEQEQKNAKKPLSPGPLKPFFSALWELQQNHRSQIRTALITSRGGEAAERPILTLKNWGVEVDETFFLSGKAKKPFINSFMPDFFFDDQVGHLDGISGGGHVPHGVINRPAPPRKKMAGKKRARR